MGPPRQERFSRFPLKRRYLDIFGMPPAQLRRATGEIRIPDEATTGGYDLVCVGSPTWWLTTSMPIRSFLKSDSTAGLLTDTRFTAFMACRRYWRNNIKTVRKLGAAKGGQYLDGVHYCYEGGQIRSLLSLISYLGTGESRSHYLGGGDPADEPQAAAARRCPRVRRPARRSARRLSRSSLVMHRLAGLTPLAPAVKGRRLLRLARLRARACKHL